MDVTRNPPESQGSENLNIRFERLDDVNVEAGQFLLSGDETARAARFAFDRDRRRYVAARIFLRQTLAVFIGAAPEALNFSYEPQGKPYLLGRDRQPLFNLSHSADIAVVAISNAGPLGVDVEAIQAIDDRDAVAAQFMHGSELSRYLALPPAERLGAFYRLWTRKEALLKAWGFGFTAEPRRFEVGFEPTAGLPACEVAGHACLIRDIAAPEGFAAAVCAPRQTRQTLDGSSARLAA